MTALGRDCGNDTREVRGLRSVGRKFLDMPPDRLELPTEAISGLVVFLESQQLIDETRHDIRAERQTRGRVVRLLALEAGTLEKRFVRQNVRRRPNLTEQPLRRIQSASFRRLLGVQGYS
jgi:hypothetical protein